MAFGGILNTPTPDPVVSFTPQKDYLSFSGIINEFYNPTTYTGTTNTLVPTDVLSGLLILSNGGAITATLPAASVLVPQIEGGRAGVPGASATGGNGFLLYVQATGAGAVTLTAGTGGTFVGGNTIAAGGSKLLLFVITATGVTPTYSVYSILSGGV